MMASAVAPVTDAATVGVTSPPGIQHSMQEMDNQQGIQNALCFTQGARSDNGGHLASGTVKMEGREPEEILLFGCEEINTQR